MSAAAAAIQFALEMDDGTELDFLRHWNDGNFDLLRRAWSEAPPAIYRGADSLLRAPVADGESWAVIAHSAMSGGAGGILAASADICKLIESGGIGEVFVYPDAGSDPGIYLWHGKFDPKDSDFDGQPAEKIDASELDNWLVRHGEQP